MLYRSPEVSKLDFDVDGNVGGPDIFQGTTVPVPVPGSVACMTLRFDSKFPSLHALQ